MTATLDDEYLTWLYKQVAPVKLKNPDRTYWSLLRQLYVKEFVWFVPNDDNRVEDGRDLRYEFMSEMRGLDRDQVDPEWLGLGCSFLEMLVALAKKAAFESDGDPQAWFWTMMRNIELDFAKDAVYDRRVANFIETKLDRVIDRTYSPKGKGGLFPLHHPEEDQRQVEIWYQMAAYILENE